MTETTINTSPLHKWFRHQVRRTKHDISLHNVIFGKDIFLYFLYRTRYLTGVTLLRSGLHVIEFSLMLVALPSMLYMAMIARALSVVIEGSWWGITDSMRHRIRDLRKTDDMNSIEKEIVAWMTLSVIVCLIILGIGMVTAVYTWEESQAFAVLILAIALQTALRLISRTFFSGAYSIRRVFLPVELIIAPEIAIFCLGFSLYWVLGEWTIAICVFVSTLLTSAITYSYVKRVTDFLRITPRKIISFTLLRKIAVEHSFGIVFSGAIASIGMRSHDMILIILLQVLAANNGMAEKMLFALYIIMPLFRSSMSCSQVMYFDLSKYNLDLFKGFRQELERFGIIYSAMLSFAFALVALCLLALFSAHAISEVATTIFPYMLLCGVYGFMLISLFSRRLYVAVGAITGLHYLLLIYPVFDSWQTISVTHLLINAIAPPLLLATVFLYRFWKPPSDNLGGYLQWSYQVVSRKAPTSIIELSFDSNVKKRQLRRVARFLHAQMPHLMLTIHYNDILIFTDPRSRDLLTNKALLLKAGGGYIHATASYNGKNGKEAYMSYLRDAYIEPPVNLYIPETQTELESIFKHRFPDGLVQYPNIRNQQLLGVTTSDERRDILHDVKQAASFERPGKQSKKWVVSAIFDKDAVSCFFLIPRRADNIKARNEWHELIGHYNYRKFKVY